MAIATDDIKHSNNGGGAREHLSVHTLKEMVEFVHIN